MCNVCWALQTFVFFIIIYSIVILGFFTCVSSLLFLGDSRNIQIALYSFFFRISPLLGNKGVHAYHGNIPRLKRKSLLQKVDDKTQIYKKKKLSDYSSIPSNNSNVILSIKSSSSLETSEAHMKSSTTQPSPIISIDLSSSNTPTSSVNTECSSSIIKEAGTTAEVSASRISLGTSILHSSAGSSGDNILPTISTSAKDATNKRKLHTDDKEPQNVHSHRSAISRHPFACRKS